MGQFHHGDRRYIKSERITWSLIEPHEKQARRNHGGQSLVRLAERGGLSHCEAVAVLEDRDWHPMDPNVAVDRLNQLVRENECAGSHPAPSCPPAQGGSHA